MLAVLGPGSQPYLGTFFYYAVGDLNGDGFVDVAMSIWGMDQLSIFMGNDAGSFQPVVNNETWISPAQLLITRAGSPARQVLAVAGDSNGASNEDAGLVIGEVDDNGILNIIDAPPGNSYSQGAIAADLNCDGLTDFVALNWVSESIDSTDVYLGSGDGGWSPGSLATEAYDIGVGDFTDDGIPDLLVTFWTDPPEFDVLPGKGDGTFSTVPIVTGIDAGQFVTCTIGDLNEDGMLDLLLFVSGGQPAFVLFGRGDGTFSAGPMLSSLTSSLYSVALQDLNGDGHLDYVAADIFGGHVYVALGNGDGTFQAESVVSYTAIPDGGQGVWVGIADVNNDGRPDLYVTDQNTGNLSFLINQCR